MLQHRFDHVGLNVRDLDAAVQWYADALDLVVDEEGGVESAGFRFVMMKSADGFRLELLSRTGSSARCGPSSAGCRC